MPNDEKNNEKDKKETETIEWELDDIRHDLLEELDDLHDDFIDDMDDIIEDADDIKEDLIEDLEELEMEKETLLAEFGDVRGDLEDLGEDARERIEYAKEKLARLREKVSRHDAKLRGKVRKKLHKARKKAVKRINISVDPEMSDEWKGWAEGLGASVSELVRKSMKFVKNNIGDIAKLEAWGEKLDKMGEKIEKSVKDSGIEELGDKIEAQFGKVKPKIQVHVEKMPDKERIKKRIQGLIKLQKSIPLEKFSQALNISQEEAENLIYELAAEGIEGNLEEGVFEFTNDPDEVIAKLFEMLDKM